MSDPDGIVIRSVPAEQRALALSFLRGEGGAQARSTAVGNQAGDRLFWARDSQQILGVGRVRSFDRQILHLLTPTLAARAPRPVGRDLLRMMVDSFAERQGAQFAQTLIPLADGKWADLLVEWGFRRITTLDIVAALPAADDARRFPEFRQVETEGLTRLQRVVESTWVESLDCADFVDPRSAYDILAEYRTRCQGNLQQWYVAYQEGVAAGCLLIDDSCPDAPLDIVYWGVVPAYRGRSMGTKILSFARGIASRQGKMMTATVDHQNWPATATFQQAGFSTIDRQELFIKVLKLE